MKKYLAPEIEFVDLQADRKIANTCWGYHDGTKDFGEDPTNAKPDQMYCDIPEPGYVGFNVTGGSCNFTDATLSWTYYTFDGNGNGVPTKAPDGIYNSFKTVISNAGGNNGQPFAGEGTIVKPTPDPSWS